MSQDNFTGQNISSTYQRLLQLSDNGNYITDGTGSVVQLVAVTSSYALTASYVAGGVTVDTSSFITTGSNSAQQAITGSLDVTGSFGLFTHGTTPPTGTPSRVGLFYFTDTDLYISLE